ncbi:MAG: hypothetical protein ABL879_10875 [Devosia sp.]
MTHRQFKPLLGLALAALCLASPALGASVEQVPLPSLATPSAYPGSAAGAMRSWVQLVWDPAARELKRISYTALDPVPELGLEMQWRPDDPAAATSGPLNGRGTLVFRQPGAPSYDPSADVASYRGTLVDGRAEGEGTWLDVSGYGYEGQWRDGLMDGKGRLQLANGDEYVGSFTAGRREGRGTYVDATGAIYDGGFAQDQREGEGLFVPARGEPYRADWLDGDEIAGSREPVPPGELGYVRIINAQFTDVPGLRVGVVAERRPHNFDLNIEPVSYTSRSDGARLDIFPDDQRLMDTWRGGGPIQLTGDETSRFLNVSMGYTPSFLGNYERFEPLSLVFELENVTTDTVAVVGGFLNVGDSLTQPEPAMQLRGDRESECGAGRWYRPDVFVDNFGWGPAENASLSYSFGTPDGRQNETIFDAPLGSIADSIKVDFGESLVALGVNTAMAGSDDFMCSDRNDQRSCLGEIRESGRYGKLADYLTLNDSVIETVVSGALDYDWAAPGGESRHKTSPFSATIQLGHLATGAECGEGGEIIPVKHEPFKLRLDEQNYRIAIPFSGQVTPGFTTRWRIELEADKTSEHDFEMVLVLADGRQIASRPVHLTYFNPPVRVIPPEMLGN